MKTVKNLKIVVSKEGYMVLSEGRHDVYLSPLDLLKNELEQVLNELKESEMLYVNIEKKKVYSISGSWKLEDLKLDKKNEELIKKILEEEGE